LRSLSLSKWSKRPLTQNRHCGLDPQSPRNLELNLTTPHLTPHIKYLAPLICTDTDFQTALEIVKILVQHASKIYEVLPTETKTPKHPNLKQQFLENLPQEFSRKDYLATAQSLNIADKTAERHIAKFVQSALIHHLAHDKYKK
jgi:hypothetical protein